MSPLLGSTGIKLISLVGFSSFNQSVNRIHLNRPELYSSRKSDDDFWLAQFEKENELIFGPDLNCSTNQRNNQSSSSSSSSSATLTSQPKQLTSLEIITNHSEVLPISWESEKLIKFPLTNPLRSTSRSVSIGNQKGTANSIRVVNQEEELNCKRNLILDKANLKVKQFPSVTKIIGETMSTSSRQVLEAWKNRMIEKLGEQGFREYQQKVFRRGYCLHQNIAKRLEDDSQEVEITEEISGYWKSLENVFTHISSVKLLEKPVVHPFLCYRGIIDCVANYQRSCYLIDWKTSSRPKPTIYNLYDEPLQVVSYLGALNFDTKYDYQVMKAAVVIAYEDGSPAHVHRLSETLCKNYWVKWIRRLDQYWSTSLQNNPKT